MSASASTPVAFRSESSLSAYGTARSTIEGKPLNPDELRKIDAYWRANLCLCIGMQYLKANPLLREPLSLEHTKPRLLGHWGSDPGQCFTYIHFNRLIKKYDLNAIYISGPGHGAPAVLSQAYLEGSYVGGKRPCPRQFRARGHAAEHAELPRIRARTRRSPTGCRPSTRSPRKYGSAEYFPEDADGGNLAPNGRVMEMLSEHTVEGWLEGYILSGRHGLLNSYESFIHVIDSMVNQHAKWLEKCDELPWRAKVSSLNLLITALVWRQDHNGFTHQDPGFLDLVVNKSPSVVRAYLPPDANCLLSVADHCLRSANYINVIIADKQVHLQYLDIDAAIAHCTKGAGVWSWASNDENAEPDIVMASCGDVPTMESLAATALLRQHLPDVKVRFVNVVDLAKLVPNTEHPHGLTDREFEALFTPDKPVVFNFHGYPWLIHRLTYRRPAQHNIHVRGYKEHGNIDTPLELAIRNQTDRFSLAIDAIDRMRRFRATGSSAREALLNQQIACRNYAYEFGIDPPDVTNWQWPF